MRFSVRSLRSGKRGHYSSTLCGVGPKPVYRDAVHPLHNAAGISQLVSLRPALSPGTLGAFFSLASVEAKFVKDCFRPTEAAIFVGLAVFVSGNQARLV